MAQNVIKQGETTERMFDKNEVVSMSLILSSTGRVGIRNVVYGEEEGMLKVYGFVKSRSREGYHFAWVTMYGRGKIYSDDGYCGCEARKYYADPCRHELILRNVAMKNIDKVEAIAGIGSQVDNIEKEEVERKAAPYRVLSRED